MIEVNWLYGRSVGLTNHLVTITVQIRALSLSKILKHNVVILRFY